MATEQLTYDHLAERLGTTREAARAIVKRHRLAFASSNEEAGFWLTPPTSR
jgi:hypothetical protein